jgi:hypothetical protein
MSGSLLRSKHGTKPVHAWTNADVIAWITTAADGKYSHIVLPPKITGAELLQLDSWSLTDIFRDQSAEARSDHEGATWVAGFDAQSETRYENMGTELYLELRATMQEINSHHLATTGSHHSMR